MNTPNRPSARVADALRRRPPEFDELSRARIERQLVEHTTERRREHNAPTRSARSWWTTAAAATGTAALVSAAIVGIVLRPFEDRRHDSPPSTPSRTAVAPERPVADEEGPVAPKVTVVEDGYPVKRGTVSVGEPLRTEEGQRLRVDVGSRSNIEIAPSSQASIERLDAHALRLRLASGAIRVGFHPAKSRRRQMTVRTRAAQVDVVGTVFRVRVDDEQTTTVEVKKGTVRVTPDQGEAILLHPGERTRVGLADAQRRDEDGDDEETAYVTPDRSPAVAVEQARSTAQSGALPDGLLPQLARNGGTEAVTSSEQPDTRLREELRFDLAAQLRKRGKIRKALHTLYQIARTASLPSRRARAWNRVADLFEARHRPRRAAEAYARAVRAGQGTQPALDAIFARGRVLEHEVGDRAGARHAYRSYLERAPDGPLADLARKRLCVVSKRDDCPTTVD